VQLIAWKDSSPNDLLCVEWDVKPYTLTHPPKQMTNPVNHLKHPSNYYTLSYRTNVGLPFLIFDSSEHQSARMAEIKNGRLDLYGAEHSKCNHMITLGFKGLKEYQLA